MGYITLNVLRWWQSTMFRLKFFVFRLHTKFEMSTFTGSEDRMGAQNLKVGHVTMTACLEVVCYP